MPKPARFPWFAASFAALIFAHPAAAATCESLATLKLSNTAVTLAQTVAAGEFTPPQAGKGKQGGGGAFRGLPAFCRVAATLTPSSDSEIKIEVWLPASGWNQKLQSVGNGAWAGTISYPAMAAALAAGYATASTDTGHTGNNANFILGHPEKVTDFAYRAVHEMTVAAKSIIAAFYGGGPKLSYWNGCSTGGRQALAEAQRYPGDYDGIIAGAPANYVTHLQGAQTWVAKITHESEAAYIPPAKYAVLHNAVLEACDSLDGVKDGVLEVPSRCNFDPKTIECAGADAPSCLTAPQVEVARKIYAGPLDSRNNRGLFPGLERGSELGWATLSGPQPMSLAVETYKFLVFNDPDWDYRTFDPAADMARADRDLGPTMNSIDPNLKPYFDRGGKLLMYHGWSDPGIAPRNSVNYYASVTEKLGPATTNSIRLFMVPGMGHCRGGEGPDTFDAISILNQWREGGQAPAQVVASRIREGKVDRTRPLCPFPQVARYKGSGSTDAAANFACQAP
jgi:feruloyl esterase